MTDADRHVPRDANASNARTAVFVAIIGGVVVLWVALLIGTGAAR